jgi:hypothetical protein
MEGSLKMSEITWKSVTERAACVALEWLSRKLSHAVNQSRHGRQGAIEEYRDDLESLASEIETARDESEWSDYAHESADSWDWVIYHYKARIMVEAAPSDSLSQAEDMVAETAAIVETFRDNGFSGLYGLVAYWLAYEAISDACRDVCEERLETIDKELNRVSEIMNNMESEE